MADTTNYATVTGRFLAPTSGTPMTGTVRFTPAVPVLVPAVPETRILARVDAVLDADGDVSFQGQKGCPLFPSDGGLPSGFKWSVDFNGLRADGRLARYDGYDFVINAGQTRDLTLMAEAAELPDYPGETPPPVDEGTGAAEYQRSGSVWTVTHALGRKPVAQVFIDGVQVFTSIYATDTVVVASFPNPQSGSIVLS